MENCKQHGHTVSAGLFSARDEGRRVDGDIVRTGGREEVLRTCPGQEQQRQQSHEHACHRLHHLWMFVIVYSLKDDLSVPAQPPLVEAKALDGRRVQLSWERPIHSTPVTGYVIVHNDTEGIRELTLTSPHEKHLITGLQADTPYSFR